MYGAINLESAEAAFETLKEKWGADYPGAIKVWENNLNHIRQLFNYPADIRKVTANFLPPRIFNSKLLQYPKAKVI